jgi:hypothetical protein
MIAALLPGVRVLCVASLLLAGATLLGAARSAAAQPAAGHAQPEAAPPPEPPAPRAEDVATIEGIMTALYESTAGPAGQARDWDRLRSICGSETRFLAARPGAEGRSVVFSLTVEDYIMHNRRYFEKGGYFETEVARRVETFGNIAQVWSTYEARRSQDDPRPYTRGINSVQLLRDGERWWVLSVLWDMERPESPIPARYLESPASAQTSAPASSQPPPEAPAPTPAAGAPEAPEE